MIPPKVPVSIISIRAEDRSRRMASTHPISQHQPPRSLGEYYLELERLLGQIEASATYYEALGLPHTVSIEQIKERYAAMVSMLCPSEQGFDPLFPEEVMSRIARSLERAGEAFSVLTNFGKRVEYDNLVLRGSASPLPVVLPNAEATQRSEPEASAKGASDEALSELTVERKGDNRRRLERFTLSIPVRVTGYDSFDGKWNEMAQSINVSKLGVSLKMAHRLMHNTVLHLTMPLPVKLRNHGHADPSYNVYAIVRRVEMPSDGLRAVGLEFLGEHPPRGYLDKPWKMFRTVKWSGRDRRQEPRKQQAEPLEVHYLTESFDSVECQLGVTENVSANGARIHVRTVPPAFDLIRIVGRQQRFESLAAIRNRFTASDGFDRLCVEFTDRKWPV